MRFGGLFGGSVLVAGFLDIATLVLPTDPAVVADVRLDDYETSWPDHSQVQDNAVQMLSEALTPFDGAVRARDDRSTVEIVGFDPGDRDRIDAAINQLIQADARDRRDSADHTSLLDRLKISEAAVTDLETSGAPEEVILLAVAEVNQVRAEASDREVESRSGRSGQARHLGVVSARALGLRLVRSSSPQCGSPGYQRCPAAHFGRWEP